MKTNIIILLSCILFIASSMVKAQECYIVIKIKGTIMLEGTDQILQKDDRICGNDNVIFKTADAVAVVHSASKGRYTLRAGKSRFSEIEGVLKYTVSSVLSKNKATLDTKSLDFEDLEDEKGFFDVYCIIDSYELKLFENEYSTNDDNYFMLRFKHNNTPFEIRLKNANNVVYLEKETIFAPLIKDEKQDKLEDVALYYYDIKNPDNPKIINAFDLSFPDEKKLADELSNYLMLLRTSGKTEEEIQDELIKYMFNAYGNVNNDNFLKWVNKNVK